VNALDLVRAARRHLAVVLACLFAAVAVAALVFLQVPVYYSAQTQLVVLSPGTEFDAEGRPQPVNPFLSAGNNAAQVTASALATVATSQTFETELANSGFASEKYAVEVADGGGGVVLLLTTVSKNEQIAARDLATVATLLHETLAKRQIEAGAPENQLFVMRDLVGASDPEVLAGDRNKLTMVAFALGVAMTVLVVVVLEGRDRRRAAAIAAGELPTGSRRRRGARSRGGDPESGRANEEHLPAQQPPSHPAQPSQPARRVSAPASAGPEHHKPDHLKGRPTGSPDGGDTAVLPRVATRDKAL
jgi:hypothetical protein